MFITSEETSETSPLQCLLHGAWYLLCIEEIAKGITEETPSTHDDVQRAVTGGDE